MNTLLENIWELLNASIVNSNYSMFSAEDIEFASNHAICLKHWDSGVLEPFGSLDDLTNKYQYLLEKVGD